MVHTLTFINELNSLTKEWRAYKNLFRGGCAYASAILARTLEKAGIPYDIIIYDSWENNAVMNNESCEHMAVKVKLGNRRIILGGDFKNSLCLTKTNLGQIPSNTLMKYYRYINNFGDWNPSYDTDYNSAFSRLCNNILKKYI